MSDVNNTKYPETMKTARREIWQTLSAGGGAGAGVAIMEKGQLVYFEGFGMADRESSRLIDKSSRFDVASISKIFTTVAALKLVDLGKLDIDTPLYKYVPDFEMADPRYKEIVPRMLLSHSSGLPGSCYNRAFCFERYEDYQSYVLDFMKRAYLKHAPGETNTYCNDGFTLMEILIERVSGQKYADFIREHITEPLGMKNTGPSVGAVDVDNVAELYNATGRKSLREVSAGIGMGGVSSSPEDLCRFGQSFCANAETRILSMESLKLMETPQPSRFSDKLRTRQEDYHLGWDVNIMDKYQDRGVRILMKGGLTWYASKFIVLPDMDVSIAISFSGSGPSTKPALAILNAFLEEKGLGSFRNPVKKPPKPQDIPRELREFAGLYASGNVVMDVAFGKDSITVRPVTNSDGPTIFIYNDRYFYKKDDLAPIPHYFAKDGDMRFFVAENEHCADLVYQKIEYQNAPKILDWDIDGKTWLGVNMHVAQTNWTGMFVSKSKLCENLPGYVDFFGIKKIVNGSLARAVGTYFRDQRDLILREENGILTAYCADYILVPAETAKPLEAGDTSITVPVDGYNATWYKTSGDFIMTIETDPGVTAQAVAADGKTTYFASFVNDQEFYAPEGSYVVFYGKKGGGGKICAK